MTLNTESSSVISQNLSRDYKDDSELSIPEGIRSSTFQVVSEGIPLPTVASTSTSHMEAPTGTPTNSIKEDCLHSSSRNFMDAGRPIPDLQKLKIYGEIPNLQRTSAHSIHKPLNSKKLLTRTQSVTPSYLSNSKFTFDSTTSDITHRYERSNSEDLSKRHQILTGNIHAQSTGHLCSQSKVLSSSSSAIVHRQRRTGAGQLQPIAKGLHPDGPYFPQGKVCRRFSSPVSLSGDNLTIQEETQSSRETDGAGRSRSRPSLGVRRLSDLKTLTTTLGLHIHGSLLSLAGTYDKAFKVFYWYPIFSPLVSFAMNQ